MVSGALAVDHHAAASQPCPAITVQAGAASVVICVMVGRCVSYATAGVNVGAGCIQDGQDRVVAGVGVDGPNRRGESSMLPSAQVVQAWPRGVV